MNRTTYFVLLCASMAACTNEKIESAAPSDENSSVKIVASSTRTVLGEEGAVAWSKGDCIYVFDEDGTAYKSNEGVINSENPAKAEFIIEGLGVGKIITSVIFCGSQVPAASEGKIQVTLPAVQTATNGSFANGSAIMVGAATPTAKDNEYSTELKNVCSLFSVSIPTENVKSISLSGTGSTLAGNLSINPADGTVVSVSEVSNKVTVSDSGTLAKDGIYYLCVLPGEIRKPVIEITNTENHKDIRTKEETITALQGKFNTLLDDKLYFDLSDEAENSANCYVIYRAGGYKFVPTKGNENTAIEGIKSVDILWETGTNDTAPAVNSVIKDALYANGFIRFSTSDNISGGNALIAAKDINGNILWSWHIWAAQSKINDVVINEDMTLMDRSIGDLKEYSWSGRTAMLYQWGRKDPFPGGNGQSKRVGVVGTATTFADKQQNYDYTVKHPTEICGKVGKDGDSVTPYLMSDHSNDDYMWNTENGGKSVNDPCPAGYRVPRASLTNVTSLKLDESRFASLAKTPKFEYFLDNKDDTPKHYQYTFQKDFNGNVLRFGRAAKVLLTTAGYSETGSAQISTDGNSFPTAYFWTANSLRYRKAVLMRISSSVSGDTVANNGLSMFSEIDDKKMRFNAKNNAYSVRCEKIKTVPAGTKSYSENKMNW